MENTSATTPAQVAAQSRKIAQITSDATREVSVMARQLDGARSAEPLLRPSSMLRSGRSNATSRVETAVGPVVHGLKDKATLLGTEAEVAHTTESQARPLPPEQQPSVAMLTRGRRPHSELPWR